MPLHEAKKRVAYWIGRRRDIKVLRHAVTLQHRMYRGPVDRGADYRTDKFDGRPSLMTSSRHALTLY